VPESMTFPLAVPSTATNFQLKEVSPRPILRTPALPNILSWLLDSFVALVPLPGSPPVPAMNGRIP
jgi:hypothetical protein